jgi:tRNA modification GTPase
LALPDTIVALGTPPGVAALAVIRLSGPGSWDVVRRVCPSLPSRPESRQVALAHARDPDTGDVLDQVLVTWFAGPRSYTGEHMAEVSCHGGWLSPSLVLDACLRGGARRAEEGEFTRRAYLNGKMDLLQAEAVIDLIESRNPALHRAAVSQLHRGLSKRIGEIREGLMDVEVLLMHHLDFPEEDDPPVPKGRILDRAGEVMAMMEELLRTAPEGELLREGAATVLAGRPNSGKSSLFNALLGEERAIVTEVPGTTRDALEGVVSLGGFPFRLVDTAGLRDTGEEVERLGVEVAWRHLKNADLILFCVEGGRAMCSQEIRFLEEVVGTPVVLVRTKADLFQGRDGEEGWAREAKSEPEGMERWPGGNDPGPGGTEGRAGGGGPGVEGVVVVSAQEGTGLEGLRKLLPEMAFRGLVRSGAGVPLLTRRRQAAGVREALQEIQAFHHALEGGLPAEVAATHLRPAETALEELLGVIPREEILDRLFREFCIGK